MIILIKEGGGGFQFHFGATDTILHSIKCLNSLRQHPLPISQGCRILEDALEVCAPEFVQCFTVGLEIPEFAFREVFESVKRETEHVVKFPQDEHGSGV